MSTYKNIVSELEELISTASKANTEAISETTKFITQLDRSKLNMGTLKEIEQKLFSEALVSVTKLNVKYISDLIQLGVNLTKRLNESTTVSSSSDSAPPRSSVSAFEIKTTANAGQTAIAAFLLNSDKNEPILCEVTNTGFFSTTDSAAGFDTSVTYTPQAFELIKGNPQRVDISIPVPSEVAEGQYKSLISVRGFEHIHFDLVLNVLPPVKEAAVSTETIAKSAVAPKAKKARKISPVKKAAKKKK